MSLFSTSGDLVNLALAIGIVGVSAAIVYFFVSAAGFIKEMRQTVDELNRQLEAIGQITEAIKSKLNYVFSYWSILEKLVNKAIDLVQKSFFNKVKNRFNRTAAANSDRENMETEEAEIKTNRSKDKATKRNKK